MSDEIERMVTLADAGLDAMGSDPGDLFTAVSDAIANLLILAHERDIDVAGAWYRGAEHYVATYIEPLSDDDAADWMQDNLYPFNGERSADEYISERACVLAGKSTGLAPEFGV